MQVFRQSAVQVLSSRHSLDASGCSLERYGANRFSKPEEGLPAGRRSVCSCKSSRLNRDSILMHPMY